MASLTALTREAAKLAQDLQNSLAVQELWPAAFDHGSASVALVGNAYHPDAFRLRVRNSQDTREFPISQVPSLIRSAHLDGVAKTLRPHQTRAFARWRKSKGY
jgi:hypothetical protein